MRDSSEHEAGGLSFVSRSSLWAVDPTGVWGDDNRTGARYAEELIAYIRRPGRHIPLLGLIVAEIARRGYTTGVEIGFFHRIALELMPVRRCLMILCGLALT